jgi:4-hydroxy-4-methyl-2-oxoglutarate aldolase
MTGAVKSEAAVLAALSQLSTPTVCNAIEGLHVRMRNEGYVGSALSYRSTGPQSIVGYAFTVRMRTASPPPKNLGYEDPTTWWNLLAAAPKPAIVVIQDEDDVPGIGSVAGEIHAAIFKSFGAIGIATNGAVRDLEALARMGMHVYAGAVSPSHAYAHIVDIGCPAEIAGLHVENGDLLHGDQHGLVSIPHDVAAKIPAASQALLTREAAILELCRRQPSSPEILQSLIAAFNRADVEAP